MFRNFKRRTGCAVALSGGVLIPSLLLLIDYLDPHGRYFWEAIRSLWMPGLVCSALFYPAGIDDGKGFIYLAFTFNIAIYAVVIFVLLQLAAAAVSRSRT